MRGQLIKKARNNDGSENGKEKVSLDTKENIVENILPYLGWDKWWDAWTVDKKARNNDGSENGKEKVFLNTKENIVVKKCQK